MLSTLFKIGPVPIHSYGLMMAIGFLLALYFGRRDAPKFGLDPDKVSDCAFWTLVLGLLGTRILYVIMFWNKDGFSFSKPLEWFAIWNGGLVFQGAIPPALVFVYLYARRTGMSMGDLLDMAAPYAALGHAMGRIGCFMNGCCYGVRTELPWGISFPRDPFDTSQPYIGSPPYLDHAARYHFDTSVDQWSFPVHPTQLYGAFGLVALCLFLLFLRKKWRPFRGSIVVTYFILYGIARFFMEMIRGDHNPTRAMGLTDQQWFSLIAVVIGVFLFLMLKRAGAKRDTTPVVKA